MSLKERVYSVLIVSSGEKFNAALLSLLPESHYSPVRIVSNISAAKRAFHDCCYDFVMINSPLPDDAGLRFAIDVSNGLEAAVLLFAHPELQSDIQLRVAEYGVFTLPKPVARSVLLYALDWLSSARERLRMQKQKTLSVEEKMAEIRLVNRAKWLLISERKMDEPQAHRYLEREAMNRSLSRRQVAEEIISLYS